jgi:predicted RNA-binding protein YlxR (DUF448 family)
MVSTRTCVICRKKNNKQKMIRIVCDENGNAIYDKNQKENSRGIYFCKDKQCIGKLEKIILKNKFKNKINVDKESLINMLNKIGYELGE